MKQVDKISIAELKEMAAKMYEPIVKADVDLAKKIVIVDMPMHADGELELIESGSNQADLWGINLHPDQYGTDDFVEFDSMINIRPGQGNRSRYVEDAATRKEILSLIEEVVTSE